MASNHGVAIPTSPALIGSASGIPLPLNPNDSCGSRQDTSGSSEISANSEFDFDDKNDGSSDLDGLDGLSEDDHPEEDDDEIEVNE